MTLKCHLNITKISLLKLLKTIFVKQKKLLSPQFYRCRISNTIINNTWWRMMYANHSISYSQDIVKA